MKARIFEGAKVTGKFGEGVITRIITKSSGYVEVTWACGKISKEMAMNLIGEDGSSLKAKPISETSGMTSGEKKRYNDRKAMDAFNALSPLSKITSNLLSINNSVRGDRSSMSYTIWYEYISAIWSAARDCNNTFIQDVCNSVDRSMRVSDKQAYVLAKFAIENNISVIA